MLDFFIVVLCLLINAFFSAYEMAFVTVSKDEIDDLEEVEKRIFSKINKFKRKPERTLSVIQIGITLVGAIAAAVGGTGAVENLEPIIVAYLNVSVSLAEALAVTIVILPLTYFSVVFGELVPKTIALKYPQKILLLGTQPLSMIDQILSPIVTFLEVSTNYILKKLNLNTSIEEDENMGEVVEIGNLPDYHQQFVLNLVSLKGQKVEMAMKPWSKVTFLDYAESEDEVRQKISTSPHSRLPVIDGETIVGILNTKELSEIKNSNHQPWQSIIKSSIIVNYKDKILESFLKLQEKQDHIAVVVNNNSNYVGIITIEDILEKIVGDINDRADLSKTSKILSNRSKIQLNK